MRRRGTRFRVYTELFGGESRHPSCVRHTDLACAGVGVPAIDNNGLCVSVTKVLAADKDGGSGDAVFCEDASGGRWGLGDDECDILRIGGFNTRMETRCADTSDCGDSAIYLFS